MNLRRSNLTPYYLLLGGVMLQGLSPVFTKLLLNDLSEAALVTSRYLLALAFFLPVLAVPANRRHLAPPRRRDWGALVLMGVLGSGIGSLLFTWALSYSHAGVVHALSKTAPLFVALMAYLTLQERVTAPRVALLVVMVMADALIGLGDFSLGGEEARRRLLGDGLALAAGVCRALSEVLAKGLLRYFSSQVVAASRVALGCAVGAVALVVTGKGLGWASLGGPAWVLLLVLAVFSTGASLSLYYQGLRRIPVHVAVALKLLSVVVTVVVSWIWLGEALNLLHLAGVTVLLAGAHLLVLRTVGAAAQPAAEAPAEVRPDRPVNLRSRLTFLAGSVIVVVVALTSWLLGSHAVNLVRDETRLAMSNVAATVVQSLGADPEAPPAARQRVLDNLVRSRLEGVTYSVQVVYALLQDRRGNLLAVAWDERNLPFRPPPDDGAAQFVRRTLLQVSADPALAERYGLVVVSADLASPRAPLLLTLGCAKGAATNLVYRIVARHVAVGLLIVFTALLSLWFVLARATDPLSEVFRAVDRVSQGRLLHPVLPRGTDEVGKMAVAMDEIRLALVRGQQWRDAALHLLQEPEEGEEALPGELVYLVVPLAGVAGPQAAAAVELLLEHEASLERGGESCLVASWGRGGPEQDDFLRALLAGLALLERPQGAPPAVLLTRRPAVACREAAGPRAAELIGLLVSAEALAEVEPLLEAGELQRAGEIAGEARWVSLQRPGREGWR